MKLNKKNIIIAILLLGVMVLLFLVSYYFYNISPVSKDSKEKIVTIDKGSIDSIGDTLLENNLIRNKLVFKLYIKFNNINNLQSATYKLNENMSLEEIIDILESGKSYNPDEFSITFKEGKNIRSIAKIVEEKTNITYDEFINTINDDNYTDELINKYWFLTNDIKNNKIFYNLEGYLFPDTYNFINKDVSPKTVIETMLDETKNKLEPYKSKIEKLDLSIHEYFTLSSIVELEGATSNDRKGVAGVFYNRLKDNWSLGSDVTTYYALKIDDYKVSLNEGIGLYKCDNAYNTRCKSFTGLPVGPICNPGLDSLLAVLEPEEHDYYYFVADCSGKTYLNKLEYEHRNTINKLKQEKNWCA